MRLNSSNVAPRVWAEDKPVRPIQMRLGGSRYSMERDEAIELARELVAAVDAIALEGTHPMTDIPMPDAPMLARVHLLLTDALARLDPADRAERIAYCQANDEHGVRMHLDDDDDVLEFVWGGRPLCAIHRNVLRNDGPFRAEFIADVPDTLPDAWAEQ